MTSIAPPETEGETTRAFTRAECAELGLLLLQGMERLAALDRLTGMHGREPTTAELDAYLADQAEEDHAAQVRMQARAQVDASPVGRSYREHVAGAMARLLEAGR